MLNTVMHTTCKALVAVSRHPITAEFNAREKLAFEILHPQVQVVKNSPTAQSSRERSSADCFSPATGAPPPRSPVAGSAQSP